MDGQLFEISANPQRVKYILTPPLLVVNMFLCKLHLNQIILVPINKLLVSFWHPYATKFGVLMFESFTFTPPLVNAA